MHQLTLRFKVEEYETVQALVDAWLAGEPVTIGLKDGRKADLQLAYVNSTELDQSRPESRDSRASNTDKGI